MGESIMWLQRTIRLKAQNRGFHLVTDEIVQQAPEISNFEVGLAHLFIKHSSASLCINENADPSVRRDMERYFLKLVPDVGQGDFVYEHDYEGADDMPAHIKSVMLGSSLTIPITNGRLALGTWQGIYLGEHRISGGPRTLIMTLQGES
jgi:secondary thiamine-phosphate synthase enzyme